MKMVRVRRTAFDACCHKGKDKHCVWGGEAPLTRYYEFK